MALRMISLPGRHHENRYFSHFVTSLEQRDVEVLPSTLRNLLAVRFDIMHIHFPTHYITEYGIVQAVVTSVAFCLYLPLIRVLGCRIVYTVHDVVPLKVRHVILLEKFSRFFMRVTSAFIFLSRSSRTAFEEAHPQESGKPWILVPHGPYPTSLISDETRATLRQQIFGSGPAFVIGFLGAIKPYKNIDALLDLPEYTEDGRAVHVVVAGKIEAGYEEHVNALLEKTRARIMRFDQRLSDADLDRWIQTVDLTLLPYVKGSNSGSALLVLSNRCRFAASDIAAFRELSDEIGEPWVYCLETTTSPRTTYSQLINRAASKSPDKNHQAALSKYLEKISWSSAAVAIETFYKDLCSDRRKKRVKFRA